MSWYYLHTLQFQTPALVIHVMSMQFARGKDCSLTTSLAHAYLHLLKEMVLTVQVVMLIFDNA